MGELREECRRLRETVAELGGVLLALENVSSKDGPAWLYGFVAHHVARHGLYLNQDAERCKGDCLVQLQDEIGA